MVFVSRTILHIHILVSQSEPNVQSNQRVVCDHCIQSTSTYLRNKPDFAVCKPFFASDWYNNASCMLIWPLMSAITKYKCMVSSCDFTYAIYIHIR